MIAIIISFGFVCVEFCNVVDCAISHLFLLFKFSNLKCLEFLDSFGSVGDEIHRPFTFHVHQTVAAVLPSIPVTFQFSKQHIVAMKSLQFPVMVHSDGSSLRSTWTCHMS